MAVCRNKKCRTILRSGNRTGYCSVCAPPEKRKSGVHNHNPFFPYAEEGEEKQWDRFLIKICAEVARVFCSTVRELQARPIDAQARPQLAIQHLISDFFNVSVNDVVRSSDKISLDLIVQMRHDAQILYLYDADFREKCEKIRVALETIGRDILPQCVDPTAVPLRETTEEEYKPYVRFTRVVAQPVGRLVVRVAREADTLP